MLHLESDTKCLLLSTDHSSRYNRAQSFILITGLPRGASAAKSIEVCEGVPGPGPLLNTASSNITPPSSYWAPAIDTIGNKLEKPRKIRSSIPQNAV
jgi:hypothetical protein